MQWTTRTRALFVAGALSLLFSAGAARSSAHDGVSLQVDVGVFYDDLAPHGRWIETHAYGWVFVPARPAAWNPYTVGHWVWTDDYGWLWVSEEPFGWATCHYGRWYQDPVFGWAWVPGYQWAPAWVSFRSGGGYMGWAPLPPRVQWAGGIRVGALQLDAYIAPRHYCFVPERAFLERDPRRHAVPFSRNRALLARTRNVTSYSVVGGRIVNRSVSVARVEHASGRQVRRMHAVAASSSHGARRARIRGDRVEVFRPAVRRAPAGRTPPKGRSLRQQRPRPHAGAAHRPPARAQEPRRPHGTAHARPVRRPPSRQRIEPQRRRDQPPGAGRKARSREPVKHGKQQRGKARQKAHARHRQH